MANLASRGTQPSLLLRMRDAHDAESWRTFVTTYAPLVHGYCRKRGLQDADAADVTQDVLAQVARSIQAFEYDPARGRFRDWLRTVILGKLARWAERRPREWSVADKDAGESLLEQLPSPEADNEWAAEFHAHILKTALGRIRSGFEAKNWAAFQEVWAHGRAAAEVADELKMPVAAVYVAKSRVLKRLRDEVLHLAEDVPQSCTR
jgi:RNA polymerase sigma-70 factor (ECF subfamily)